MDLGLVEAVGSGPRPPIVGRPTEVRSHSNTTFLTLMTGGGLAVVGGLVSGMLPNWLSAKRDQRTHEHEQVMAREARRQERLEQTYIELLTYLSHHLDWAKSIRPMWGPIPMLAP